MAKKVTVEFDFSDYGQSMLEKFAAKYNMTEEEFIKDTLQERLYDEEDSEIGEAAYNEWVADGCQSRPWEEFCKEMELEEQKEASEARK